MTAPTAVMAHASSELYGSDRAFLESVIALRTAGWRVVVAVPQVGPLVSALEHEEARVVICRTPVLRKAALGPAGFARVMKDTLLGVGPMVSLIRAERPDVIYVNTVTVPLWLPVARVFRRPVLVHIHEAEDLVPGPVRAALYVPLVTAHTVVVNSRATQRLVERSLRTLAGRTRLVYNGVRGPTGSTAPKEEPSDPVRVVLVGRVSPRKGTDTAVQAIGLLRRGGQKAELRIVGAVFPGYEWFEERLWQRIREERLEDAIRLDGFSEDVWATLRWADIAIVPSRSDSFGNASIEAQLAGVPVIVSNAQGLPETVDGGRLGTVVPPEDPRALADAIRGVVEEWPAARERARVAMLEARDRFAPDRYARDIVELANGLARQHEGGAFSH